jgi:hypothetical protein
MRFVLKLAALGSLALLGLSVYPGVIADVPFIAWLFFPLWLPVLGNVLFILIQSRTRVAGKKSDETDLNLTGDEIVGDEKPISHRRWSILSPAIVVLSLVLIMNGIPRKAAFLLSRPGFQRYAATAPTSEHEGDALKRWLGVYFVDRYAADPRGGV